uniref:Uncharacterized protein LOC100187343 n=1 Tax=Phallusia mammillata TaxID=59560 RepID=A0A6F9DHY1_9ASCI|nr:uncharacterized protein LOC100187343 [Phallusia mammillata]
MDKLCLAVTCIYFMSASVNGLSEVEFAAFKTNNKAETNSGLQGSVSISGTTSLSFTIKSNGIPDHPTGPSSKHIRQQAYSIAIPNLVNRGVYEGTSNCLPEGLVGFATNGVPLFNSFSSECCNSANADVQSYDKCWGEVDSFGRYHYKVPPMCLTHLQCNNASSVLGVALDGYPIYGPYDELGRLLSSSDLDICHGRLDRHQNYRYHMTFDFPYTVGCFRGTPPPGYLPVTCGCTTLVEPCHGATSPPVPVTPGRKKRNAQSSMSMSSYLLTSVAPTCCVSGHNCTTTTNPHALSSAQNISPLSSICVLLFMHLLAKLLL